MLGLEPAALRVTNYCEAFGIVFDHKAFARLLRISSFSAEDNGPQRGIELSILSVTQNQV